MLKNKLSREIIAITILLSSQVLMIAQVFKKFIPITDGWYLGIAEVAKTRLLYKDISFPFPPGTYFFEGVLPNFFNNPVVAEQIMHSAQWIVLSLSLYSIMRFVFSREVALVASVTALTFFFAQPGNIISGYFELMYMFYFLGWGLLLWGSSKHLKSRFLLLHLGSVFLVSSLLIKQTAFLPVICSLVFFCLWIRKTDRESFTRIVLLIASGSTVPFLIVLIWSLRNGVFIAMLQNLAGGGKNPGGLSLIVTFGSNVLPAVAPLFILFSVCLLFSFCFEMNSVYKRIFLLSAIWILFFQFSGIDLLQKWNFATISGFIFVGGVLTFANFVDKLLHHKHSDLGTSRYTDGWIYLSYMFLAFSPMAAAAMFLYNPAGSLAPNWSGWFTQLGSTVSANFVACGLISLIFIYCLKKFKLNLSFLKISLIRFDLFRNLLLISTVTFYIMNSFAGGVGVEVFAINIAFILGYILHVVSTHFPKKVFISCILIFIVPWNIGASAFQIQNPYEWYGVKESPLNSDRQTSTVPRLSSFSLSSTSANDFDVLYKGVRDGQSLTSGTSTEVFFGSRNLGLASMFGVSIYPIRCPILWWDICPEASALESFDQIRADPPKVVVWTFESNDNIASNENGWRENRSSAVSKIQNWFLSEIGKDNYRVIAETNKKLDVANEAQVLTRVLVRDKCC